MTFIATMNAQITRSPASSTRVLLRALGNRLVGILHGCLVHHTAYDDHDAWGHRQDFQVAQAA